MVNMKQDDNPDTTLSRKHRSILRNYIVATVALFMSVSTMIWMISSRWNFALALFRPRFSDGVYGLFYETYFRVAAFGLFLLALSRFLVLPLPSRIQPVVAFAVFTLLLAITFDYMSILLMYSVRVDYAERSAVWAATLAFMVLAATWVVCLVSLLVRLFVKRRRTTN